MGQMGGQRLRHELGENPACTVAGRGDGGQKSLIGWCNCHSCRSKWWHISHFILSTQCHTERMTGQGRGVTWGLRRKGVRKIYVGLDRCDLRRGGGNGERCQREGRAWRWGRDRAWTGSDPRQSKGVARSPQPTSWPLTQPSVRHWGAEPNGTSSGVRELMAGKWVVRPCGRGGGRLALGEGGGQAVEEERGAMESAGAGVWPGLVAEPRWLA